MQVAPTSVMDGPDSADCGRPGAGKWTSAGMWKWNGLVW
jgi:hypothetical protein